MKVLLIHTDGCSIDVVGKYNTKEEACKQLNFEYVGNIFDNPQLKKKYGKDWEEEHK